MQAVLDIQCNISRGKKEIIFDCKGKYTTICFGYIFRNYIWSYTELFSFMINGSHV